MRARFLTSASTTHHGASGMSVAANIASLAREKSTQRLRASRSIGLSFQRLVGSCSRAWNRFPCLVAPTRAQDRRRGAPPRPSSARRRRAPGGAVPALGGVVAPRLEPLLLLGVAHREPVLEQRDPAPHQ